MKAKLVITSVLSFGTALTNPVLANDEQILLKSFHDYGMSKCDSFILENSKLNSNWNYFIDKHVGFNDEALTEVTVTQIFGSKGDTIKTQDTYIQTATKCFLRKTWTLTFSGSCAENIDGNAWYVSTKMPDKDYTTYKNAGGLELHAKEISMGNFKACVQEGSKRANSVHG